MYIHRKQVFFFVRVDLGYLEVQGEMMSQYLSPPEVKTPEMDLFECNSPISPISSTGDNKNDSLWHKNKRKEKFRFAKQ